MTLTAAEASALMDEYRNQECPHCFRWRIQSDGVCDKCFWDSEGGDYACVTRPDEYSPQGPIFTKPDENLILGAG